MLNSQLAAKYAEALFELAKENKMIDKIEQELFVIKEAFDNHQDMRELIYHPRVPNEAKKDTIHKVFGAELSTYVKHFVLLLIDKRRETALMGIIRAYVVLANEARNIIEANVITAKLMSDEQRQKLTQKLVKLTGNKVLLQEAVDPGIIGGVIVKIGDKLIDGSVRHQLKSLHNTILKTEVTKIGVTS